MTAPPFAGSLPAEQKLVRSEPARAAPALLDHLQTEADHDAYCATSFRKSMAVGRERSRLSFLTNFNSTDLGSSTHFWNHSKHNVGRLESSMIEIF
jgi:hypothetical protein